MHRLILRVFYGLDHKAAAVIGVVGYLAEGAVIICMILGGDDSLGTVGSAYFICGIVLVLGKAVHAWGVIDL